MAQTTAKQVGIVDSIPDKDWSDSKLVDWLSQNQGKVFWNSQGQQQEVPKVSGGDMNKVRYWLNDPHGLLYGMSNQDPQANQGQFGSQGFPGYGGVPVMQTGSGSTAPGYAPQGYSSGNGYMQANPVMQAYSQGPAQNNRSTQSGGGQAAASMTPSNVNFRGKNVTYNPTTGELSFGQGGSQWVQNGQPVTFRESDGTWTSFNPQTGELNNTKTGSSWMPNTWANQGAAGDQAVDPNSLNQPETNALANMAQVDPASETLRQAVANSYLTPLQQAGQAPDAATYKSYLDAYQGLDPTGYATRKALGESVNTDLAAGSQLDPVTARQVEQQTRLGQAARGNVYGTPQMVQEAMTTGQAGLALKQQRQQAAQSYLSAGLGLGDTALNLYQQNQGNLRNAQSAALSYLSSGQTPYQAGANYEDRINNMAGTAAQGGPVYNPASLGTSYSGSASAAPAYGQQMSTDANSWYNSLQAYSGGTGTPQKNRAASAAGGALSGAVAGAQAGSVVPGYGTLIGAGVGAIAGGAGGYFS